MIGKNVSDEEGDVNSRNPMLYDPLHESKTTKTMQYVAAILSKPNRCILYVSANSLIFSISVCFGAISAGTALAWTSPVIPQLEKPDNVSEATNATNGEFYLTSDQSNIVNPRSKSISKTCIVPLFCSVLGWVTPRHRCHVWRHSCRLPS